MKKKGDEVSGVFCEIFGETPRNKIIEFLLETRELDYSIGDIAKEVKLNRATTYNVMEGLIEEKIVVPTRKVSNGQLYKLNPEKEEVKALIQVFNMLLKNLLKNLE